MDHSHVNGAINLTTITSSTSPSESPSETPTYQSDYEQRTEEQVSLNSDSFCYNCCDYCTMHLKRLEALNSISSVMFPNS